MPEKPHVIIYSDGSCKPNPGPGGWGAILIDGATGARREISGGELDTTNNRMEMTAAIMALERLRLPSRVDLYTDSSYLRNAFEAGWIARWQKNGWMTAGKKPVLNKELWEELTSLNDRHDVVWHWVKGHSVSVENNRADELANAAREALEREHGLTPKAHAAGSGARARRPARRWG